MASEFLNFSEMIFYSKKLKWIPNENFLWRRLEAGLANWKPEATSISKE
jgi:hypothetical protein